MKKHLQKILFLALAALPFFFLGAQSASATAYTWTGGGDGVTWNSASNWSGGTYPSAAADTATFSSTASEVTTPAGLNIAGLTTSGTFSGILTQGGAMTIGATGLSWGAGTFTGGSAAITTYTFSQTGGTFTGGSAAISTKTFTQTGGTFTSTSGTMDITYSSSGPSDVTVFNYSSGTFNANNGRVKFSAVVPDNATAAITHSAVVYAAQPIIFYDVQMVPSNNPSYGQPGISSSGGAGTLTVMNTFTHTNGVLYGIWYAQGNIVTESGADGGTGTLIMNGSTNATYTQTSGGTGPGITIQKPTGYSVTFGVGTTNVSLGNFSLVSNGVPVAPPSDFTVTFFSQSGGTFTAPSGVMTVAPSVSEPAALDVFTFSGGTFDATTNHGTVVFGGRVASNAYCSLMFTSYIYLPNSSGITFYNLQMNMGFHSCDTSVAGQLGSRGSGAVTIANNVTFTNGFFVDGNWNVQGSTSVASTADGGAGALTFTGPNNQTYTNQGGTAPTGAVTINKTAGTVTLGSAFTFPNLLTLTAGTFNMYGNSLTLSKTGTALSIASGATFRNASTTSNASTLTLSGNVTNNGSFVVRGRNACAGTDIATIASNNTTKRVFSGTGTYDIEDASLSYVQAPAGGITTYSSTLSNTTNFNNQEVCPSSGTYTSSVIDTGLVSNFTTMTYVGTVLGTLSVAVGAGDTLDPNDSSWTWASGVANGGSIASLGSHRYAQYVLTAGGAGVLMTSVTINYAQYKPNQSLTSSMFDSGSDGNVMSNVSWNETNDYAANGTYVGMSLRTAATAEALALAAWSEPLSATTTGCSKVETQVTCDATVSPALLPMHTGTGHRWFQYKAVLSTTGAVNPSLNDVTVRYTVNAPPDVRNVTASEQQPNGTVAISYEVRDRDTTTNAAENRGFVTPSFEYSTDNGVHWTTISSDLSVDATSTKAVSTDLDENGESTGWSGPYTATWTPRNTINGISSTETIIRVTADDLEAANRTGSLPSLAFTLDLKAPAFGVIPVKVEAKYEEHTDTNHARIILSATDDSDFSMAVGTQATFSDGDFAPYASTTTLSLTATIPTVYVQLKDEWGNTSTVQSATTPLVPQKVIYRDLSNIETDPPASRVFLSWDPIPAPARSFAYYRIYRSTDGESYSLFTSLTDRSQNYIIDGIPGAYLDPELTYYYKIYSEDIDGNLSYFTPAVSHQPNGQGGTDNTPPTIDEATISAEPTPQTAKILWTTDEPASGSVTYCETSCADHEHQTQAVTTAGLSHQVILSGLTPNTLYEYTVTSADFSANSAISEAHTFTTLDGASIIDVSVTRVTNREADIEFNTDREIASEVHFTVNTTPELANEEFPPAYETTASLTHKITLPDLLSGHQYYFYVAAGASQNRNTKNGVNEYYSFATSNDGTAPVITNVATSTIIDTQAIITWTTNEGANSAIEWGSTTGAYAAGANSDANYNIGHALLMSGLTPDSTYYYRVGSADRNGNAATSTEYSFTTMEKQYGETDLTAAVDAARRSGQAEGVASFSGGGGGGGGSVGIAQSVYNAVVAELDTAKKKIADTLTELDDLKNNILGIQPEESATPQELLKLVTAKFLSLTKVFQSGGTLDVSESDLAPVAKTLRELASSVPPPIVQGAPDIRPGSDSAVISWITDKQANSVVAFAAKADYDPNRKDPYTSQAGAFDVFTTDHKVTLSGLLPSTEYHFQIRSASEGGSPIETKDFVFSTGVMLPVITNARVEQVPEGVKFAWKTNVLANSAVRYAPIVNGKEDETRSATFGKPEYELDHAVTLDKLKPGTTYVIELLSTDPFGNTAKHDMSTFTTGKDTEAPVITEVKSSITTFPGSVTKVQTIIFWTTDELSTSQVLYEEGAALDPEKEPKEATKKTVDMSTLHTVVITSWKPSTVYSFRVSSVDASGNVGISKDFTVKTPQQKASIVDILINNFSTTFGWAKNL